MGDLVMVVRGHECYQGRIYTVIRPNFKMSDGIRCGSAGGCGQSHYERGFLTLLEGRKGPGPLLTSWLKRIDPPALPETTDQPAELTA